MKSDWAINTNGELIDASIKLPYNGYWSIIGFADGGLVYQFINNKAI